MPNLNVFSLEGKTALVVGASRGIGLAIARQVARAGAHTVLAARSVDQLSLHAAALEAEGCLAEAHALDVTSRESLDALMEAVPAVDILINVSGTNIRKQFTEYSAAEYEAIMSTNLHGLVEITKAVGRRMLERGKGGKIIFIGSITSLLGLPYLSIYAMTKSALAGLTRSLAAEWAQYNIQVNCIGPGFIVTDLNREMWQREDLKQWLAGNQASPRLGDPQDIAPLATFLSGPGSDYITGQVIMADGGYSTTAVWPFEP